MQASPLTSEEFREVIGHFPSGVTVITTTANGVDHGTTASAVTSLSVEPPMLIACLNRTSQTGAAVAESGVFAVNILAAGQADLAARFATKGEAKFGDVAVEPSPCGPLIAGALAIIECHVREVATGGTHTIFVADAQHGRVSAGDPLAYFRGAFGRLNMGRDDDLCDALRRRIASGRPAAGGALEIRALADELGAPRDAVYHALTQLRTEGLVTRTDDGGFAVIEPTLHMALDVFDAIFALWLGAAATSIEHTRTEDLERLAQLLDRLRPRPEEPDWSPATFVEARNELLDAFITLPHSDALRRAWRQVDLPALVTERWAEDQAPGPIVYESIYHGFARVVAAYATRDLQALTAEIQGFRAYSHGLIEAAYGVA